MNANDGREDVFEARVRLGLRELDGVEQPPDVTAGVLQRLDERESPPSRSSFPRWAVAVALLASAVTATLLLTKRSGEPGDESGVPATQGGAQDPDGPKQGAAWRLVYEPSPADLQRWLAENRDADVDQLLARTIQCAQQRLGAATPVTRGDGVAIEVKLGSAKPSDIAAARDLLEYPGRLDIRAAADADYAADGVRFDMARERTQLRAWLDAGGAARLQADPRAIAEYRAGGEHLRWFVHLVRPRSDKPDLWDVRYVGLPLPASWVAAHAESEWDGGTIPADIQARPVERRFLVELLAVNMHEVHFRESDVDPTSVRIGASPSGVGASVTFQLLPSKVAAFAAFSEKYLEKCDAMIWNGEVLSAPRFMGRINAGTMCIVGPSSAQADVIGRVLATPMPVELRLLRSEQGTAAPLRVLVVDDQPTWSWRYVRAGLRRDPRFSVSACIVGEAVDATRVAFPATAAELAAYDVIVCGDFAVPGDDAAASAWCQALAAFVRGGGGVIFECGPESSARLRRPELAALLPVQLPNSAAAVARAPLTLAADSPVDFTGVEQGKAPAALFAALQPIGYRPVAGLAPSARAIAVDAAQQQPVLASMEVEKGRTVWVGSDETWRWQDTNAERMEKLWARLVRFAAAGRR